MLAVRWGDITAKGEHCGKNVVTFAELNKVQWINPSCIFLQHFGIPGIAFGKKRCKMKSTKREPLNAEAQPNHFHWPSRKPTCKLHLDPTRFWEFWEAHSKQVTPSAISSETVKGLPPFQAQIGASDTNWTQSDLELVQCLSFWAQNGV